MVDLRVMNNVISQYSKMFVSLGFFFLFSLRSTIPCDFHPFLGMKVAWNGGK